MLMNPSSYCEAQDARPLPAGDWSCVEISSDRCPDAPHHLACRRPFSCRIVTGARDLDVGGAGDPSHDEPAKPLQVEVLGCPRAISAQIPSAVGKAMKNPAEFCGDADARLVIAGDQSCEEIPSDLCPGSPHHLECVVPVSCEDKEEAHRAWRAARAAQRAARRSEKVDTCQAYAENLRSCSPYRCRFSHPMVSGFVIEHVIVGTSRDVCVATQTVPGGMVHRCRFPMHVLEHVSDYYQMLRETGGPTRTKITLEHGELTSRSFQGDREMDASIPALMEELCSIDGLAQ